MTTALRRVLDGATQCGWMPYTWLVYLGFYIVSVAMSRPEAPALAGHVVVIAVFLAFYFRAWIDRGAAARWDVAGMVVLGMVTAPITPSASTFFIYAAAFTGHTGTRPQTVRAMLAGDRVGRVHRHGAAAIAGVLDPRLGVLARGRCVELPHGVGAGGERAPARRAG